MFSADPASASLVESARTTGLSPRKWLFTAIVAVVSVIPCASFAIVFPVHGATTRTSNIALGPIGSAAVMLSMGDTPQISVTRSRSVFAVPNRVSIAPACSLSTGVTLCPRETSLSMASSAFEKVQNEPVMANPILKAVPPHVGSR